MSVISDAISWFKRKFGKKEFEPPELSMEGYEETAQPTPEKFVPQYPEPELTPRLEMISKDLETIKANLETINERLDKIEEILRTRRF